MKTYIRTSLTDHSNLLRNIRYASGDIRKTVIIIFHELSLRNRFGPSLDTIHRTHYEIWDITKQILDDIDRIKKGKENILITSGSANLTQDSFELDAAKWTEILSLTETDTSEPNPPTPKHGSGDKEINLRRLLQFNDDGKCTNAYKLLTRTDILKISYNSIKSKPGNMVRGVDRETLNSIPIKWFEDTSKSLVSETFKFRPSRRVYIPKPNGKKRPLGISSPRDKIVQQAMRMVMESMLDKMYDSNSHGFRPSRGCHSALSEVRKWTGVPWLLEGDIKGFFDNIDHHVLARLITRHFSEPKLIHLYWKLVKAGYVEFDQGKKISTYPNKGVPQGGIISPLLSNLVLHEFDKYMRELISQRMKENANIPKDRPNRIYNCLSSRIRRLREKLKTTDAIKSTKKDLKRAIKERNKLRSTLPNPLYIQYTYTRYADDWLVGVWGPKQVVKNLKQKIWDFLSGLKLELSLEKTLITNTRTDKAKFLGVMIHRRKGYHITKINTRRKSRIAASTVIMNAPLRILIDKLMKNKFIKVKNDKLTPLIIPDLTPLPVKDLILHYRSILTGIMNYYSFVDNRSSLYRIYKLIKGSLTKTICYKEKLSLKEFTRSYGRDIKLSIQKTDGSVAYLDFSQPSLTKNPMNFLTKHLADPLEHRTWKITKLDPLNQPCSNCGSREKIEMHHIKHIKTLNVKLNSFDKMVATINRKQVPICRDCHTKVHKGTYFGFSLKHFKYNKWNGKPKWS